MVRYKQLLHCVIIRLALPNQLPDHVRHSGSTVIKSNIPLPRLVYGTYINTTVLTVQTSDRDSLCIILPHISIFANSALLGGGVRVMVWIKE